MGDGAGEGRAKPRWSSQAPLRMGAASKEPLIGAQSVTGTSEVTLAAAISKAPGSVRGLLQWSRQGRRRCI